LNGQTKKSKNRTKIKSKNRTKNKKQKPHKNKNQKTYKKQKKSLLVLFFWKIDEKTDSKREITPDISLLFIILSSNQTLSLKHTLSIP
jgi:hypothetical protein